jgi:hypothetical protein
LFADDFQIVFHQQSSSASASSLQFKRFGFPAPRTSQGKSPQKSQSSLENGTVGSQQKRAKFFITYTSVRAQDTVKAQCAENGYVPGTFGSRRSYIEISGNV